MHTKQLDIRNYHIVNHSGNVDACAQFIYKGYMVSFSTMGLSRGACQTEVAVFAKKDADDKDYNLHVKMDLHTVEEAIEFINELTAVK